jgi:hypothetical protein
VTPADIDRSRARATRLGRPPVALVLLLACGALASVPRDAAARYVGPLVSQSATRPRETALTRSRRADRTRLVAQRGGSRAADERVGQHDARRSTAQPFIAGRGVASQSLVGAAGRVQSRILVGADPLSRGSRRDLAATPQLRQVVAYRRAAGRSRSLRGPPPPSSPL